MLAPGRQRRRQPQQQRVPLLGGRGPEVGRGPVVEGGDASEPPARPLKLASHGVGDAEVGGGRGAPEALEALRELDLFFLERFFFFFLRVSLFFFFLSSFSLSTFCNLIFLTSGCLLPIDRLMIVNAKLCQSTTSLHLRSLAATASAGSVGSAGGVWARIPPLGRGSTQRVAYSKDMSWRRALTTRERTRTRPPWDLEEGTRLRPPPFLFSEEEEEEEFAFGFVQAGGSGRWWILMKRWVATASRGREPP